jgi:hypothetical protein
MEPASNEGLDNTLDLKLLKADMEKSISHLRNEMANLRTGRANPGMLDHLRVVAHGSMISLKEVGHVALKSPQMLSISVFDPAVSLFAILLLFNGFETALLVVSWSRVLWRLLQDHR